MAQVAEIEDFLLYVLREAEKEDVRLRPVASRNRLMAGKLLKVVEALVEGRGLSSALESQIEFIRDTIRKRNALVHSVVRVGFADDPGTGGRVAVLVYLNQIGPGPGDDDLSDDADLSELELETVFQQAQLALGSAVEIWKQLEATRSR